MRPLPANPTRASARAPDARANTVPPAESASDTHVGRSGQTRHVDACVLPHHDVDADAAARSDDRGVEAERKLVGETLRVVVFLACVDDEILPWRERGGRQVRELAGARLLAEVEALKLVFAQVDRRISVVEQLHPPGLPSVGVRLLGPGAYLGDSQRGREGESRAYRGRQQKRPAVHRRQ